MMILQGNPYAMQSVGAHHSSHFLSHLFCSICDIVNHITATIYHDYKYFT